MAANAHSVYFLWHLYLYNIVLPCGIVAINCLLNYQAIEDLTKALELEKNSTDILHERGKVLKPIFLYTIF